MYICMFAGNQLFDLGLHCRVIKTCFENHSVDKLGREIVMLQEIDKENSLPSLESLLFSKPQIFVGILILHKFTEPTMELPCLTWWTENSVNIQNVLWLSRRLTILTEQTIIYMSTFPYTLTSEQAKNHEISIYYKRVCRKHIIQFEIHVTDALVSRRSKLLS